MQNSRCPLVALVGRPNVGKSTLFNRITKARKAIVDPTPGVTRDRHYEKVTVNDRQFILVDTGGIEIARDETMSSLIQQQTQQAIEEADIIVLLLDARGGLLAEDYEVVNMLRRVDKPFFHVVNKIDGPEQEETLLAQFYELGIDRLWGVSAEHGYGVAYFLENLVASMAPAEEGEVLPDDTIKIACIGRPNVGKSSLINRLLGEERMVVSEIPGTTRDAVDTLLERNGRNYLLIDTAGIRRKGKVTEKLEKFSVMRALSTLERCDIALLLIDAGEGITEQDTKVISYALERGRACLLLVNKWDLVKNEKKQQKKILEEVAMATRFMEYAPVLNISALTGAGTNRIFSVLDEVYKQYTAKFSTNMINNILRKAVETHNPSLHKGKRLKFYYTTQVGIKPPTFIIFVNYPKGVHFSYHRFLANQFSAGLGLDKIPVKIILKERQRKKYD
ncbi:MAG: ribosome biogenesis GTPase Der [Proteobacteria bacterium]|nr:ribosome biogenesis GTPase Der [Pseudomonadota bacterium]MBU4294348.1 ribosome biogenesis GTPase Der [Pseudomonadota bacterium]MCG2749135.1 ribosome biogenesis GTPase Der [Desulfobulbaceae bacterium]